MAASAAFMIHYPTGFDERAEYEMVSKGYLAGVTVELTDGSRYPVFFYDPIRLGQELAMECQDGRPFVAEVGMVVVPEVTREAIAEAVNGLVRIGFFHHLTPVTSGAKEPAA